MHDLSRMLRPGPSSPPRTTRRCFAFANVAFEVLAQEGVHWELPEHYDWHVTELSSTPPLADVICSVRVDRTLSSGDLQPKNGVFFEVDGERTSVSSGELRAELSRVGHARYAATARISDGSEGVSALLLSLTSAILQAEGGLNFHAAAIEIEGHAVLFLGPSGAGKSTAVTLATGTRVFAYDRVGVLPHDGKLLALSLPGGEPADAVRSPHRCLPLAALMRIRRGQDKPQLRALSGAARAFVVRESVEISATSPIAEGVRMQRVLELSERLPVFDLHTVLGQSTSELLLEALRSHLPPKPPSVKVEHDAVA